MAPRRFPKRSRQIKSTLEIFKSPPEASNPSTHSKTTRKMEKIVRSPEIVMLSVPEPLCMKELSPKILHRPTKLRLNLDIPEEEPEDADCDKENINILEKTMSMDKVYGKMEFLLEEVKQNKMADEDEMDEICETFSVYRLPASSSEGLKPLEASSATKTYSERIRTQLNAQKFDNKREIISKDKGLLTPSSFDDNNDDILTPEDITPPNNEHLFPHIHEKIGNLPNNCQPMAHDVRQTFTCQSNELSSINYDKSFLPPSPPPKRCRTTLKFDELRIRSQEKGEICGKKPIHSVVPIEEVDDLKIQWMSSPECGQSVDLPITESGCKSIEPSDPQIVIQQSATDPNIIDDSRQTLMLRIRGWWLPVRKIFEFCRWVARKVVGYFRRGLFSKNSRRLDGRKQKKEQNDELGQVITVIKGENEKLVIALSERMSTLTKELTQTRVTNETSLSTLTREVENLKNANEQLLNSNETLKTELKRLSDALDKFKSSSRISQGSCPPPPPPPPPMLAPCGPPPPPPPPPPMPLLFHNTPTTPALRQRKSPSRKCSTPLVEARPSITVEDLLKVTLKKAPTNLKDNRSNSVPSIRGPVVSLDMLRSVKLKSARRRSVETTRSPRRVHPYKSRTCQSLTLSPITARERSPLHRILRQVDGNRRGFRRTMMSPTHSDHETTRDSPKKIDARCNRSHSIIS